MTKFFKVFDLIMELALLVCLIWALLNHNYNIINVILLTLILGKLDKLNKR
jgi:hypothetical protein